MKNGDHGLHKSFSGKGVFPHKYAFTLLIPLRNVFLSPKKLVKRLALEKDFQVLEIGPGPGYFSPTIAQTLPEGKLVLADIQQEMLNYAKKRIEKRSIKNVEYNLCDGKSFDFENESFDCVFMVTVIGEVENQKEYLEEIFRILKKGGVLSISELAGDPDKLAIDELVELVCTENFKVKKVYGNKINYTINFEKCKS
jgi:ubiquinone/menaquinone biosynthesis C-methylase UbiE